MKEQFCIIDGIGSHRTDWQNKGVLNNGVPWVACDSHSKLEIDTRVNALNAPPLPTDVKPEPAPQGKAGAVSTVTT